MGILPPHPQGLQKHSRTSDLTRLWICKFGRNITDYKDLNSPRSWKRVGIGGMSYWATGGSLPPAAGSCCAAVALPTTQREHTNFYHNQFMKMTPLCSCKQLGNKREYTKILPTTQNKLKVLFHTNLFINYFKTNATVGKKIQTSMTSEVTQAQDAPWWYSDSQGI